MLIRGWLVDGLVLLFVFQVLQSDRLLIVEGRQSAEGHPVGQPLLFKGVGVVFVEILQVFIGGQVLADQVGLQDQHHSHQDDEQQGQNHHEYIQEQVEGGQLLGSFGQVEYRQSEYLGGQGSGGDHQQVEGSSVVFADAGAQPGTVVVQFSHTQVTGSAVVGAEGSQAVAAITPLQYVVLVLQRSYLNLFQLFYYFIFTYALHFPSSSLVSPLLGC